jgi:hypothetical protein
METLPSELNLPQSKPESNSVLIMRFIAGAIIGLLVAAISLSTGVIGCLFLA